MLVAVTHWCQEFRVNTFREQTWLQFLFLHLFFKPSDVRSNLLSTLYQISRPQWSNFLINVSLCLFFILWFLKIILKCHVIKLLITIPFLSIFIASNLRGLKASYGRMFHSIGLILLKRMDFLTCIVAHKVYNFHV